MSGTRWKGKKLINAMGHQFEHDLKCKVCNKSWFSHQDDKTPCDNWKLTSVNPKKIVAEKVNGKH